MNASPMFGRRRTEIDTPPVARPAAASTSPTPPPPLPMPVHNVPVSIPIPTSTSDSLAELRSLALQQLDPRPRRHCRPNGLAPKSKSWWPISPPSGAFSSTPANSANSPPSWSTTCSASARCSRCWTTRHRRHHGERPGPRVYRAPGPRYAVERKIPRRAARRQYLPAHCLGDRTPHRREQPMVDARLADGSRVNIVFPPLALDGPYVSIRKFTRRKSILPASWHWAR